MTSEINQAQKKKTTNTDSIHTRTFEYSGSPGDGAGVVVHRDSVEGGGRSVSGSSVLQDRVHPLVLSGTPERMVAQQ